MKFGICAGILFQAFFAMLFLESLKTGFSAEVAVFAFCVFMGFVFTLFCGSMRKSQSINRK